MPGITDVSFMQMKRNNTPFNYACQECSPRVSPVEASSLDVESVHLNVEPSILHAQIIVPAYDIPTQAIENNIPANNIPAPANETVIRNPACPMTRLFERMAAYRKAKNASRAQLCLGPLNSSVHPRCDARLDTKWTISPIDVLEQQIIVTPDSEENGDSYFVRPVPIVESSLEDASESDKTNSGVGGWEYHEAMGKRMSRYLFDPSGRSFTVKNTKRDGTVVWRCTVRPKKDPCPAIAWQQS
ncbi:hypothetical protein DAPPUDRAFT_336364, partial [Daphnia pulex]